MCISLDDKAILGIIYGNTDTNLKLNMHLYSYKHTFLIKAP